MSSVFDHLHDEDPQTGASLRARLLQDALRGFLPLRKVFVQRPNTAKVRASVLADLVTARQHRPLDAFLLVHALEPVLAGSPLALATWARLLSRGNVPCTSATASKALDALVDRQLITRVDQGRRVEVMPLLEDGSERPWSRPGSKKAKADLGPGYFTLPYNYWITGLADRLDLPGKALLLIALAETSLETTFSMAVERAPKWYGISERTAERGYQQLESEGVMHKHRQLVVDARSPTGLRAVWHRALIDPYSTAARRDLQAATRTAARARTHPSLSSTTDDAPANPIPRTRRVKKNGDRK